MVADFDVIDWDVKVNAGSEFGIDVHSYSQQPALSPGTSQLRKSILDAAVSLNADVCTIIINYMPITLASKVLILSSSARSPTHHPIRSVGLLTYSHSVHE
jgi:hypothetical protein